MHKVVDRPRHSDGPWTLGKNTAGEDAVVDGSGIFLVAIVKRWHTGNSQEWRRNAALIVSAPDLLEALKALRDNVEHDLSGYWTESTSNFMQMADAAIAKAEGRQ